MPAASLYDRLLEISTEYLGPAAHRFIDRNIRNHLNKEPESITIKDLDSIAGWMKISISLLTEDSKATEQFIADIKELIRSFKGKGAMR